MDGLVDRFAKAPEVLNAEIHDALGQSIAMVETEAKRRTPVKTGYLRSSIGANIGDQNTPVGYSFIKGLTAGVGTNVSYSVAVHEGHQKHNNGERKYMEKGLEAASDYIKQRFEKAFVNLADYLAKG